MLIQLCPRVGKMGSSSGSSVPCAATPGRRGTCAASGRSSSSLSSHLRCGLLDYLIERLEVDWLPNAAVATTCTCPPLPFRVFAVGAQDNDPNAARRSLGSQRRYRSKPIHQRHVQVHQYQIRKHGGRNLDRLSTIGGLEDRVAVHSKQKPHRFANVVMIVGDKNKHLVGASQSDIQSLLLPVRA